MLLYVPLALSVHYAEAQVPVTAACIELNRAALAQAANGRFEEVEIALSASLAGGPNSSMPSCAGLVLNNLASRMAVLGRLADAEMFAKRSVDVLEKSYPADDPILLAPLQILAAVRLEQGKRGGAIEAFGRMRSIRIERPENRATVHSLAAALFQVEGRHQEAESEYFAALNSWEEAGRGETADAGAVLNSLAALYVEEQRFGDARQLLDRALTIFASANNTVAMDRIKFLSIRAALHARQGEWREAEQDLHDAVTLDDREGKVDPFALRKLLTNYALALRKNHRRKEARVIESRLAALDRDHQARTLVDVADLLAKSRHSER